MRVITAYSHKGGTGKTTALLMLASAIDAAGKSAFLVDCDPHLSFKAYQTYSRQAGPEFWSDKFDVRFLNYEATRLIDLEDALDVVRQLSQDGEVGEARVVLTKMRAKMTAAQRQYIGDILQGFPHLETQIRETAIFGDLVMRGLLGRSLAVYERDAMGLQKAEVKRLREALTDCQSLLAEVDSLIREEVPA